MNQHQYRPHPSIGDPPMPPRRPFSVTTFPRPLKQVRYPVPKRAEHKSVTVCIAVICQDEGAPRIVLCADTRLDAGWAGSSDGNLKLARLAYGWMGMLSGDWNGAKELHSWLKAEFLANPPFDRSSLYEILSAVGKNFISGPLYRKDKPVEIIVCGFLGTTPTIAVLGVGKANVPHVDFRHSFAASGAGQGIAETFLNVRDCKPQDSVERVIYAAYEAKKYSEKASGVGAETRLTIMAPVPPDAAPEQAMFFNVAQDDLEFLEQMRKDYGVQTIRADSVRLILGEVRLRPPAVSPDPQHPTTGQ